MFTTFTQWSRPIRLALPVIALCGLLTVPVLAAPPSGPVAPGFLAQIWHSVVELVSGPAPPPPDEPGTSELHRMAGKSGGRFDPVGYSQELQDPTTSDGDSLSFSSPVAPEDQAGGTPEP